VKAITAQQANRIDHAAQKEFGIPSIVLMENAGRTVSEIAADAVRTPTEARIGVFAGKGNNGGDGLVCARYLINAGFAVSVFILAAPDELKNDPGINLAILRRMKAHHTFFRTGNDIKRASKKFAFDLIIDAIFGIGFSGIVEGLPFNLISRINDSGSPVISVDIPSGLDATTGKIGSVCVRASKTVTFGLPKKGLFINDGPRYAGEVIVKNIGFPASLLA